MTSTGGHQGHSNTEDRDGGSSIPEPDALFDTRTGLNISDSIGDESITIGGFPLPEMLSDDGAQLWHTGTAVSVPDALTAVTLFKRKTGVTEARITYGPIIYVRTTSPTMNFTSPTANKVTSPLDWTQWQLFGQTTQSDLKRYWLWNKSLGNDTIAAYGGTVSAIALTSNSGYTDYYHGGTFIFNKKLSDTELADIRNNLIFPTDGSLVGGLILNSVDDTAKLENYEFINRWRGRSDAPYDGGWATNAPSYSKPTGLYAVRADDVQLSYTLKYGYSRLGVYVIAYPPTGVKGAVSDPSDVEFPATDCIHNMAESRLNFSGVTDATIKAIFDKSNRTYWKASIESTDHYVDAGSGYYGLWHPTELISDFIDLHAETGHNGHILASLRTSGSVVTGITAIRVYKTSL
jgi:hypothetical protein